MSLHMKADPKDIAESILLPGDPLRAKYIAEKFFENAKCYNEIRGTFGYTGTYKGMRVSVQATGMGMPSMDIYCSELFRDYKVKKAVRIGTCGSYAAHIKTRDLVLAMCASTDSAMNSYRLKGTYAPCADFDLLLTTYALAKQQGTGIHCGNVFTTDAFYDADPDDWKNWADYGVIAVDMETAALYTLAAKYKAKALSIMAATDNFVTGERLDPKDRERSLDDMILLALESLKAMEA